MPKANINGVNLYYEEWGHGEPLLLIMGMGANTTDWEPLIPDLSQGQKLIAFDNRVSGRSDKPGGPLTMELFADDAVALLDTLGIEKAHIFGVSMGGMIAQELALRYPERLLTLILGATMCGGSHAIPPPMDRILEWINTGNLPPAKAATDCLPFLYSQKFIDQKKSYLIKSSLRTSHLRIPKHDIYRQLKAITHFDSYDRLPQIQVPTLVLTGNADLIVPAENSRILTNQIPEAELIVFEGIGHGFLVEVSAKVNSAVIDFLRRHKS